MKNDYHVFLKTRKSGDGKTKTQWCYYFYDQDGRKAQRICPDCQTREDADRHVKALPPLLRPGAKNPGALLRHIAENMYIPGSGHADRRRQLGKSTALETMAESRAYVRLIMKEWGDVPLKDVDPEDVMTHLFQIKRSGSWKNRFLSIFREIYHEAPRYGCRIRTPEFPSFARNSKKADIFTNAELAALFNPGNFPGTPFYLLFLLSLSGGLRLGEARGARYRQVLFNEKVLVIDGFCKKNGERTAYNKTGTPDNPKLRAVWLPDSTLNQLYEFTRGKGLDPDDFLFTYDNKPIRQETAEAAFARALISAGIARSKRQLAASGAWEKGKITRKAALIPDGRKLCPHSLRYTYVSRMRLKYSARELLPMTGHSTEAMVDYYNRKDLDLIIAGLPPRAEAALENLMTFRAGGS